MVPHAFRMDDRQRAKAGHTHRAGPWGFRRGDRDDARARPRPVVRSGLRRAGRCARAGIQPFVRRDQAIRRADGRARHFQGTTRHRGRHRCAVRHRPPAQRVRRKPGASHRSVHRSQERAAVAGPGRMILPEGLSLQRPSQPEEAESCARLMSSTEPWITLGRSREASLDLVRDAGREVYIARVGGLFAGFLILNMRGAFVGYIQTVCLVPEQRGHGLGTAIIGWAEDRIFRESPNVFMCVSSFNKDAQRLYQRLGYTVIGELTDYLVPGHSEILLRKSKGPWSRWAPRPV